MVEIWFARFLKVSLHKNCLQGVRAAALTLSSLTLYFVCLKGKHK